MKRKKLEELKARLGWKIESAKIWCKENKEVIVVIAPCLIGGALEIVKIAAKKGNVNEEKRLKEEYIYDRTQGHYYELRRKPKSSEWVQIDLRKSHGEPLGMILSDMGLLK